CFVEHHNLRFRCQRPGNRQTLSLTTGELQWMLHQVLLIYAHNVCPICRLFLQMVVVRLSSSSRGKEAWFRVLVQCIDEDAFSGPAWVERTQRILIHRSDLPAASSTTFVIEFAPRLAI